MDARISLLGWIERPVTGPAWSANDAISLPFSKTLTEPLDVEKKTLAPSHTESVIGSLTCNERSTLSASIEYIATSPCSPPTVAYPSSTLTVVAWGTGSEFVVSTVKEATSSAVAHPWGTGRLFRLLDNL